MWKPLEWGNVYTELWNTLLGIWRKAVCLNDLPQTHVTQHWAEIGEKALGYFYPLLNVFSQPSLFR